MFIINLFTIPINHYSLALPSETPIMPNMKFHLKHMVVQPCSKFSTYCTGDRKKISSSCGAG